MGLLFVYICGIGGFAIVTAVIVSLLRTIRREIRKDNDCIAFDKMINDFIDIQVDLCVVTSMLSLVLIDVSYVYKISIGTIIMLLPLAYYSLKKKLNIYAKPRAVLMIVITMFFVIFVSQFYSVESVARYDEYDKYELGENRKVIFRAVGAIQIIKETLEEVTPGGVHIPIDLYESESGYFIVFDENYNDAIVFVSNYYMDEFERGIESATKEAPFEIYGKSEIIRDLEVRNDRELAELLEGRVMITYNPNRKETEHKVQNLMEYIWMKILIVLLLICVLVYWFVYLRKKRKMYRLQGSNEKDDDEYDWYF